MKLLRLLKLPIAVLQDVATLGGTVNDGYWRNGKCSYTTKVLRDSFLCK
jgi:hypothetical protein